MGSAAAQIKEPFPESDYGNGHTQFKRGHWKPLLRRCNGNLVEYGLIMHLYDDLISPHAERSGPPPKFAYPSIEEMQNWTGAPERSIHRALAHAERMKFIGREFPDQKTNRGGYAVYPESFREPPLPMPRPPRVAKPKTAKVSGSLPIAALRMTPVLLPRMAERERSGFTNPSPSLLFLPNVAEVKTGLPPNNSGDYAEDSLSSPFIRFLPSVAEHPKTGASGAAPESRSKAEAPVRIDLLVPREAESLVAEGSAVVCPIGLPCPYVVKKEEQPKTTTTEAPPKLADDVVVVAWPDLPENQNPTEPDLVFEALRQLGSTSTEVTARLKANCRVNYPEATDEEIAREIRGLKFSRNTDNPIGVVIKQIPKHFVGYKRTQPRAPDLKPQVCPRCSGSGLVGVMWTNLAEAKAAIQAGARICECEAANLIRSEFPAEGEAGGDD